MRAALTIGGPPSIAATLQGSIRWGLAHLANPSRRSRDWRPVTKEMTLARTGSRLTGTLTGDGHGRPC